jgi:hypothetical protein
MPVPCINDAVNQPGSLYISVRLRAAIWTEIMELSLEYETTTDPYRRKVLEHQAAALTSLINSDQDQQR